MSSDGYFGDDFDFDESALAQIDAIEAAHFSQIPKTTSASTKRPGLAQEDSFDGFSDMDEAALAELEQFDAVIEDIYQGKTQPAAGPSKITRTPSSNMLQTTLTGEIIRPSNSSSTVSKPRSTMQRTTSNSKNVFGKQARKTKTWDQTAFAQSGSKKSKTKSKGKGKEDDNSDEEQVEFKQFPAPFMPSNNQPPAMKLEVDLLEARHWIFPTNRSKRDYQFNIIRHCLFENTLVALPTGLGKTFIAGVVMLNYYRWFPEGKVVFVAPTKPLVGQQVTACHETCGIPGGVSIEMTGEVPRAQRIKYWAEKRVFFMTPQTLVNDLVKETCDPRDIVLLVIDEAHRATGNYAYNQVMRALMPKNPHFRVLALTATPGNEVEAVQSLIDGLHISHIEIRNEESLDLRQYIHKKNFIAHIIKANEPVTKIRDLIVACMKPYIQQVVQGGLMRAGESAVSMHPYRPQALMKEAHKSGKAWLFSSLSKLSKLCRAMMYLLTGSIESCHQCLQEIADETENNDETNGQKKSKGKKLKDDPNFRTIMQEMEMQHSAGYSLHPKMEELLNILIQHFGKQTDGKDDSCVMVFSSYRAVVDRIVEELSKHKPLLRPTRFIGQGTDKQGRKGLAQKEQLEVIEKFQAGEYNILVATSIGEEGLDIGEIDVTICYDADKAPTRMIQRFGRTGRKREGTIHALLSEEREELNIEKAEARYFEVQKTIAKGEMYELYADVERLIPEHMKPECIEKVVEIQKYVREKKSPRKKAAAGTSQAPKRKRNDDIGRNIPDGASMGFVSVKDLVTKGPKKKKMKVAKDFDACGEDDETDEDIESGRVALPRRTQSAVLGSPSSKASSAPKGRLRKAATATGAKATKPRTKKAQKEKQEKKFTLSQFSKQGDDDSDDMDIEYGAIAVKALKASSKHAPRSVSPDVDMDEDDNVPVRTTPKKKSHLKKTRSRTILSPLQEPSTPPVKAELSILELTDSEPELTGKRQNSPSPVRLPPAHPSPARSEGNMGWLVDDDDDDIGIDIVNSSPSVAKIMRRQSPADRDKISAGDQSIEMSWPTKSTPIKKARGLSRQPTDDSLIEFVDDIPKLLSKGKGKANQGSRSSSPEVLVSMNSNIPRTSDSLIRKQPQNSNQPSSPTWNGSSSPLYPTKELSAMPPPALPRTFLSSGPSATHSTPEPSHPVRPLGYQAKRRRIVFDNLESPFMDEPPLSQRRLHRVESTPINQGNKNPTKGKDKVKKTKRVKPSLLGKNKNLIFDGEAAHSGEEVSEGISNSEDDVESESDRMFIKDSPLTQASTSYEQTQFYQKSLMTQYNNGPQAGPGFTRAPVRIRPFGNIDGPRIPNQRGLPSSSPPDPDEELDTYEYGSFVVADDEDVSYLLDQ
ncbi:hypothetical protein CPB83DRAFT_841976 [Crepidotus variabilis]|uniref:ATP-dependent DNA helicase n=1 Tax=Crepidotus variabilis TaxID=179855 RepID=A0A9P6JX62_9AGAR|nr:hypothetical protein CPB83DRAFT_841976 [Crepidotus variabilis]